MMEITSPQSDQATLFYKFVFRIGSQIRVIAIVAFKLRSGLSRFRTARKGYASVRKCPILLK